MSVEMLLIVAWVEGFLTGLAAGMVWYYYRLRRLEKQLEEVEIDG